MRKYILFILLALFAFSLYGQKGIVNNGARIVVDNGAYIKIQGDNTTGYTNESFGSQHGRIDLNGEIQLDGYFRNNASAGEVFINLDGTGNVLFSGTSNQGIGGSGPITFENLELNTPGIDLNTSIFIQNGIIFSQGNIVVNNYILAFGSNALIMGSAGTNSMLIPGSNGVLRKYFDNAQTFTFPIGSNVETDYIPVTIDPTGGTYNGGFVDLQMTEAKHPENSNPTDYITRYWQLSETDISGYDAQLTFTYAESDIVGNENNYYTLRYDGSFWDVFDAVNTENNTLTASVSEMGEFTAGANELETGELVVSHSGLTEENLNGAVIDLTLVDDEFENSTLDPTNFGLQNVPQGCEILTVDYVSTTTATMTLAFDGTDFDTDYTDYAINMTSAEVASDNDYTSNVLLISATDDNETLTIIDPPAITEGSEDGHVFSIELSGGTFNPVLNADAWSCSWLPEGVTMSDVLYLSPTSVEVHISGNRVADYDINQFVTIEIEPTEYNDAEGNALISDNDIAFQARNEQLTALTDTIYQSNLDNIEIYFELIDDWIKSAHFTIEDIRLYGEPEGLSVENITMTDSTHFSAVLSYTGSGIGQDNPFSFEIADSVLFGVEALNSQDIIISSDVGINEQEGAVELYVAGSDIYLKQHQLVRKGSLIIFELNGRRIREYSVKAKSASLFRPILKDGMYLIQFLTDDGKLYQTKGVVKN
ncbi:hypothetical protein [Salinivirga cyanobacteriivorans]